ncbi:MAG TPA: hypothetical protein VGG28_18330 [Kofleriaceae bacterium]|jgi:hypothetical protein
MRRFMFVLVVVAAYLAWRYRPWQHASPPPVATHPVVVVVPDSKTDQPVGRSQIPDAAVAVLAIDAGPPEPFTRLEIPGSDRLASLIVVGDRLVWTDSQGSIWTMPTTGGNARELANQHEGSDWPMYGALVQHRDTVYAARDGVIATVALPDGPVTPVTWDLGSAADAYELASDGTALYAAMMTGAIDRFADDGTHTTPMHAYEGGLAMGSDAMYMSDFGLGIVVKLAGKPRVIAHGIPMLAAFAVADRIGYAWSQQDSLVHRIDLATGKVTALWPDKLAADYLRVDGDWVYTFGLGETFVRIARDGHVMQTLAEHVGGGPITSDADAIYVGQLDGNAILRFDKERIAPLRTTDANVAR